MDNHQITKLSDTNKFKSIPQNCLVLYRQPTDTHISPVERDASRDYRESSFSSSKRTREYWDNRERDNRISRETHSNSYYSFWFLLVLCLVCLTKLILSMNTYLTESNNKNGRHQ